MSGGLPFREPPEGWQTFGAHAADGPCGPTPTGWRFSDEKDEDGFPLWERHDGCVMTPARVQP